MRTDPNRVLRDVGRKIAELRLERGWTQEIMARRAGVNAAQISVYESGRANLTLRTLSEIALLLGVDARTLLEPPRSKQPRRPGRPKKLR